MALSGSRNSMRFVFVRQISEEKLQSKIRLSGGVQEHVRLMQTLATYQSWDRGRGSDNTVIRTQRAQCVSTLKQISVLAKQQKNSVISLGKLWYCTNEIRAALNLSAGCMPLLCKNC